MTDCSEPGCSRGAVGRFDVAVGGATVQRALCHNCRNRLPSVAGVTGVTPQFGTDR